MALSKPFGYSHVIAMDAGSVPHERSSTLIPFISYMLSFLFAAIATALVWSLVHAALKQPLSDGWTALKSSPYGLSALADYAVGSMFGVIFVYFREGPSFLFMNYKLIALLSPFVGSFLPLFYLSFMLFKLKDYRLVFFPKTAEPELPGSSDPPAKLPQSRFILLFFGFLLTFFTTVCIWAFSSQSWNDGVRDVMQEPWIAVTFQDNLSGLILTICFVACREGVWLKVVPWTIAFGLLGNAPTCIYVIFIACESLRRDIAFSTLLLSQK